MPSAKLSVICAAMLSVALAACSTCGEMQAVPDKGSAPAVNGALILEGPPAANSPGQQADEASYQLGRQTRNTPRGKRAAADADMNKFKPLLARFSETTGVKLTPENVPETYRLLEMTWPSIVQTMKPAKEKFGRSRPFVTHTDDQTCRPDTYKKLSPGSYPSGHTMRSWTVALTLTALMPDLSEKILKEGYDIGESRWMCGPHWKTDVEAGRTLGAAVFARLAGDKAFTTQMQRAKDELGAKRGK